MELPTSNRKKLLTFDWLVLSQKSTLFPFFGRSYLGNRLTYIAENLHRFFFKHYLQVCQISSKSEGGLANLANNWLVWHGMTHTQTLLKLTQTFPIVISFLTWINLGCVRCFNKLQVLSTSTNVSLQQVCVSSHSSPVPLPHSSSTWV